MIYTTHSFLLISFNTKSQFLLLFGLLVRINFEPCTQGSLVLLNNSYTNQFFTV